MNGINIAGSTATADTNHVIYDGIFTINEIIDVNILTRNFTMDAINPRIESNILII